MACSPEVYQKIHKQYVCSILTAYAISTCKVYTCIFSKICKYVFVFFKNSSFSLSLQTLYESYLILGPSSQSVTCLATDASLTADPGVTSLIPARSHTLVQIDHEIISTVFLLPSAESFKKCCCQLQAKVCARSTG